MKIWIVNPYGELPSEGWREYRSSMLARALAASGHEVVWWISNFEHRSKTFRSDGYLNEPLLPEAVKVYSVQSSSYSSNVSFARIRYEYLFGKNLNKIAVTMQRPDVIVLADPSLFYSTPVVAYAKNMGSKIILDVLDLWPEQFQVTLPKFLRPLGTLIFSPLYARRQRLVGMVDGVVAVTKDHLFSVKVPKGTPSLVAYLGIDYDKFNEDSRQATPKPSILEFVKDAELVVVYAGTLGEAYDIKTVLQATEMVINKNSRVKFIFAGEGPFADSIQSLAKKFPHNIIFIGRVSSEELPSIYELCHVGICSYSKDSTVTMPVKLYDYLAGGLYVIYSLNGEIDELLSRSFCGSKYAPEEPDEFSKLILDLSASLTLDDRRLVTLDLAKSFDESLQHGRFVEFIEAIVEAKSLVNFSSEFV